MGYCAVGSLSSADWSDIKRLCQQLKKEFNEKIDALEHKLEDEIATLDTSKVQTIVNQVNALKIQLQTILSGQETQDQRLDNLEETCANIEITTSEVIEAYNGV